MGVDKPSVPHDIEAEKCLLGSVLLSPDAFFEVSSVVTVDAFFSPSHRIVWNAVKEMFDANKAVDVVLLKKRLQKAKVLDEIGGEAYLVELFETVPHAAHAAYYAKIVTACSVRRRFLQAGEEIIRKATQDIEPEELAADAEQRVAAITETMTSGESPSIGESMDTTIQAIFDRLDQPEGTTGYANLDRYIHGFQPGRLYVLAARPAIGKTALACNFAIRKASDGPEMIFSLEMTKEELIERMLCMEANVSGEKMRRGDFDEADHHYLTAASQKLSAMPIHIDDQAGIRISQLCAKARKIRRKRGGMALVMVDYIQLVEADDPKLPREQQVSTVTRKLKQLAKDLRCPVLALCQLNRDVEKRTEKRPTLSDLRESGAIEQDADVVMLMHRPDAYEPDDRPNELDIIVAKNRHGSCGTAGLIWQKQTMRFADRAFVEEQF